MGGRLIKFALAAAIAFCQTHAQGPVVDRSSVTTRDRLEDTGWWPTKGEPERSQYVGSETCSGCHRAIAALQETTPMYHAGVRAGQSEILQKHDQLNFQESGFRYSLVRTQEGGVTFSVSNGEERTGADAVWAFGAGEIGQTYVLEKGDDYIEGRLSYFTRLDSLSITIGHPAKPPEKLEEALGQRMYGGTAQHCFGCHTTASTTSLRFEPEKATPGVTCESCHGPGARHVAAMNGQVDSQSATAILNPAHLSSADSVDFCGACHRTSADVTAVMPANIGVLSVRFQPYRLEKSRCWKENGDARITCIACHDPHQPLVREDRAYDSKCLACHSAQPGPRVQAGAKTTCRAATSNCVSCHMPKYEVPQANAAFTDHFIRVVSKEQKGSGRTGGFAGR